MTQAFAKIEAINTGHRPVTITSMRLELPGGSNMFPAMAAGIRGMPNTTLPATLTDGQSACAYISYRDIAEGLIDSGRTSKIKVVPVCEDSAGGIYKGAPWDVDPAEFRKM